VLIALKSGSLNLLEPSGPVQACNGIALPFSVLSNHLIEALPLFLVPSVLVKVCLLQEFVSGDLKRASKSPSPHF